MKFLCPRHRRMFNSLSLNEKNDLWLLWMEYAITFSENRDSDKLIAASGSAFDLGLPGTNTAPGLHAGGANPGSDTGMPGVT